MATTQKPRLTPAKTLLRDHGLPLDANAFFNGLELCGLLERTPYESTTGSGEIKHYLQLIGDGLQLGENRPSGWHEFKTEPKFFDDRFASAYLAACTALYEHAKLVCIPTPDETAP
jgi:hypothetical protein